MPAERVLTLTPSRLGLPADWTSESFRDELVRAAASFSEPAVACTSLRLRVAPTAQRRIAEDDGTSLVVFRPEAFCHNERCGHIDTFPLRAMAMTGTYPSGARGAEIREGDIELNAAHFRFAGSDAASVPNGAPGEIIVPLRAVLLHELGHVVGLLDRCVPEGSHGVHAAIPELERCGPHEAESVMFAPALNPALSPLDIAALCAAHPRATASARALESEHIATKPSVPEPPGSLAIGTQLASLALVFVLVLVVVVVIRYAVSLRSFRRPRRRQAEGKGDGPENSQLGISCPDRQS